MQNIISIGDSRMNKFISVSILILLVCLQCSSFHMQLDTTNLVSLRNILVYTYDEKGHVSVFVPPEFAGVSAWGSFITVTMVNFDNASLEQAINHVLKDWSFESKLYQKVISLMNEKCTNFNIINNEALALKKKTKDSIFKDPTVIDKNPELKRKLITESVDALLLLNIRYYGPFIKNAFASCKLKCNIDVELIKISNSTAIWKHRINLDKLKLDELLFNLTMYEYLEGECKNLKKSLEKAIDVISKEIITKLCN